MDRNQRYSIIPATRTPDNSNSPYLELKLNPLALILLHNLPPITRTFVNSNHFHRSLGGSSYREYTVSVFKFPSSKSAEKPAWIDALPTWPSRKTGLDIAQLTSLTEGRLCLQPKRQLNVNITTEFCLFVCVCLCEREEYTYM